MKIKENYQKLESKYHTLVFRERVLTLFLLLSLVFFIWYLLVGISLENSIESSKRDREKLLSASESIMSNYDFSAQKQSMDKNIALIDKRISTVKSKVNLIDEDIRRFNERTIDVGKIVLLLRDILIANNDLTLESLKVFPAEILKKQSADEKSFEDAFEKNVISLKLKGDYASVFDYLTKIEALEWSVFWQDVKYVVEDYPLATVDIQLYTLSILDESRGGDQYATR